MKFDISMFLLIMKVNYLHTLNLKIQLLQAQSYKIFLLIPYLLIIIIGK